MLYLLMHNKINKTMELEEIKLDDIRELISNKAYNVLIDNNILTVGDVMNFSVSSFAAIDGVGVGKVQDYERFKYILKETPAVIVRCYEGTLPREIQKDIADIHIDCLENLMHKHVFNLLINNGYEKVSDLSDLSVEKFKKLKASGKAKAERYADFLVIVFEKQELIIQAYQESLPVIIPSKFSDESLLQEFKCFIEECYSLRIKNAENERKKNDVIRAKVIIEKFYALEANADQSLGEKDLSVMFDISSARIGMIRNEELDYLRNLINDTADTGNKIILNHTFLDRLDQTNGRFTKKVYPLEKMHEILRKEFFAFDCSDINYLQFLLLILGFHYSTHSNNFLSNEKVYIKLKNRNDNFKKRYFAISLLVFDYLRNIVLSVDINKLYVEVNKVFECSLEELNAVCENSSFIEILIDEEKLLYRLKFSRLSASTDMAFRILSEREEKAVPIEEIVAIINAKLVDQDKAVNKKSLSATMSGPGRFKSVAKTGLWALKSWDVNTDTMDELLLNCFRKEERDLSVNEIHNIILNIYKRDDIKEKSIRDYLASERYFSIGEIGNRTYISYEYKHRYADVINAKSKNDINWDEVVKLIKNKPNSSVSDILTLCKKENIELHENSLRDYLNNEWIIKTVGMPNLYALKENYKELILNDIKVNIKKKVLIKKAILDKLSHVDQIALSKLVVFCEKEFNKKPPYVYGLIDDMEKEISINKLDLNKKLFVSAF